MLMQFLLLLTHTRVACACFRHILLRLEYAILSIAAFSTAVHLVLHVVDSRMEGAWHGKATWIMLLEFFSEVYFQVSHKRRSPPPALFAHDSFLTGREV